MTETDLETAAAVARRAFESLGFEREFRGGNGYQAYSMGEDRGSVSTNGGAVSWYVNGHVGFAAPGRVTEGLVRAEIEPRLKSSVAGYYKCRR